MGGEDLQRGFSKSFNDDREVPTKEQDISRSKLTKSLENSRAGRGIRTDESLHIEIQSCDK